MNPENFAARQGQFCEKKSKYDKNKNGNRIRHGIVIGLGDLFDLEDQSEDENYFESTHKIELSESNKKEMRFSFFGGLNELESNAYF